MLGEFHGENGRHNGELGWYFQRELTVLGYEMQGVKRSLGESKV